ncbi:DMT family transporter [Actinocatenispora rupis]|uniref:Membrane protein n=1 Tax=Actinocatenispora rupis TaxID=519421 RepID=A0A8J3J7Z4_9ACTN|nr:DMT family transporter [Actinocatenispora rupis]GID11068.1 membrane protein [Actinocatenispora rupis]
MTTDSRRTPPAAAGRLADVPTPPRRTAPLTLVAAAVTVLLWASAFVAIRQVGHVLSPGPVALGRLVVASLVLGVVVLFRRERTGAPTATGWPRGRAWLLVVVCGVAWFGIYNVALNAAERRVDAGTAAMLVNIGPILVAVLAGLLLREGFPRALLVGSLVAFAGVVVIGLATSSGGGADGWGVVLCLVSAVAYAVGVVSQKPLLATVSALRVTWLASTVAAVCCLPYAPSLVREVAAAPSAALWVVFLGVGPTALAFTTWAYALARTSAGRAGTTTYLVPPLAILLGWLLLGEVPVALAFAGGALCLFGVWLSRRRPRIRTVVAGGRPEPAGPRPPEPSAAQPVAEPD